MEQYRENTRIYDDDDSSSAPHSLTNTTAIVAQHKWEENWGFYAELHIGMFTFRFLWLKIEFYHADVWSGIAENVYGVEKSGAQSHKNFFKFFKPRLRTSPCAYSNFP